MQGEVARRKGTHWFSLCACSVVRARDAAPESWWRRSFCTMPISFIHGLFCPWALIPPADHMAAQSERRRRRHRGRRQHKHQPGRARAPRPLLRLQQGLRQGPRLRGQLQPPRREADADADADSDREDEPLGLGARSARSGQQQRPRSSSTPSTTSPSTPGRRLPSPGLSHACRACRPRRPRAPLGPSPGRWRRRRQRRHQARRPRAQLLRRRRR